MFGLTSAVRVYLAAATADMRKSFDGLAALETGALGLDPLSGPGRRPRPSREGRSGLDSGWPWRLARR